MDKVISCHQLNPTFLQENTVKAQHPNVKRRFVNCCHALTLVDTKTGTSQQIPSCTSFQTPNISMLDQFRAINSLESVKIVHTQIIKVSKERNFDRLEGYLIKYYMKFGDFESAAVVFLVGFGRIYQRFNLLLQELRSNRKLLVKVLEVFNDLNYRGMVFDCRTFGIVLEVCEILMDIWFGVEIHACLIKRALDFDAFIHCALISFYEKCCGVEYVNGLFDDTLDQGDLAWNEAIKLNVENEKWMQVLEIFQEMLYSFEQPSSGTITKVLKACGKMEALNVGKQIHGYVLRNGFESNVFICNSLITMYARNHELKKAQIVFDTMEEHNLTSWNSIISAYSLYGCMDMAWNCFREMVSSNKEPDVITWNCLLSGLAHNGSYEIVLYLFQKVQFQGLPLTSSSITNALQAVIAFRLLKCGKEIHCYVIRHGLVHDVSVGTSLLGMYAKCDCIATAQAVFNNMKIRNLYAWNSLISGYSSHGLILDAENLLNQMQKEGLEPDLVTWNSLVSGYSVSGQTQKALELLSQIRQSGLRPNVVIWTSLISGCSQAGNYKDSLEFFNRMKQESIEPNSATICSLLQACGGLSLLHKGAEIHCFSLKNGITRDTCVATAIMDMYSKVGNLRSAHEVFKSIQNKPLASWNCMIMAFAMRSRGKEAITLFHEMHKEGHYPDGITFTALLSACKNSGLVNEGWSFFDGMSRDYDLTPTIEHYGCMVDLLGKAGYLDEAWDFIQMMPLKPDGTIWGALLSSCRIHKNVEYAEIALKHLIKLEPHNYANYLQMMNLYSMSNRWKDVDRVKALMNSKRVKHGSSWSWIQVNNTIHYFSEEDDAHPDAGEIFFELYKLVLDIKSLGYVPDINCVYQNIDNVEKEKVLLSHTEKLAITYGLMKTKSNTPIRVVKNSRVCSDCHVAAKYISLARNREIIIKDGLRFHHFREGSCSCKDCW